MFFSPVVLPVSQLKVIPKLGMANAVLLFLYLFSKYGRLPSEYGDTPCAVHVVNVSDGEMMNWECFATALPAGLMLIDPRSPPSAVKALPIAIVLAVPS